MGGRAKKTYILFKLTLTEQQIFKYKNFFQRVSIFSRNLKKVNSLLKVTGL